MRAYVFSRSRILPAVLGLALAVLPLPAHGAWSGAFESELLLDVEARRLEAETTVSVDWTFANGAVSSTTDLSGDGWTKQTIRVEYQANRFEARSTTTFEPHKNRFKEWKTTLVWEAGETHIEVEARITRTTRWATLDLEREGKLSDGALCVRLRAPSGSGAFAFYDTKVMVESAAWGVEFEAEATFTSQGLDDLCITLSELRIERLPAWDLQFEFIQTTTARLLALSVNVDTDAASCLALDIELDSPATGRFSELSVSSLSVSCQGLDAHCEASAYFGPAHWKQDDVWLIAEIEKQIAFASCGRLRLEASAAFAAGHGSRPISITQELAVEPCDALDLSLVIEQNESGRLDSLSFQANLVW